MDRTRPDDLIHELPLLPTPVESPLAPPPPRVHDLKMLALEVQREYFPNIKPLPIRWGRRTEREGRQSIRLGSYHHRTTVIRIHPRLDSPVVPAYFIQSIIHHEYLHHVLGGSHGRRFHAYERKFRNYAEARRWLKANLMMLLGRRNAPRKKGAKPLQLALF